jgi:hypothetical protein
MPAVNPALPPPASLGARAIQLSSPNRMLFSTALNCPALPNCATTGRAPRASIL